MMRDTWRAVLVVVVAALLREIFAERPAPPVPQPWQQSAAWQPPPPIVVTQEPKRPIRRVAQAITELGDSLIGVVQ